MGEKLCVGDWVTWEGQARKGVSEKRTGEIIAVVSPQQDPDVFKKTLGTVFRNYRIDKTSPLRDHESYLVAVPMLPRGRTRKVYWPKVKTLSKIHTF